MHFELFKQFKPLCFLISLVGPLASCTADEKLQTNQNVSADANAEVPCTKVSCPKIPLLITANPVQDGRLFGSIISPTPWTITGAAQGGSLRDIRLTAFNPPIGGSFEGKGTLNVTTNYSSIEAIDSKVPIRAFLRDVSLCEFELEKVGRDTSVCRNMDQTGLEEFEVRTEIPWSIVNGNIDELSDPSFLQQQAEAKGANAGVTGCLAGALPGVVQNLVTSSVITGIIGGPLGCIKGNLGNLGN